MEQKQRVLVAMSGGVDSSLTAALLLEQGYDVIGATMQLWPKYLPVPENETGCCSLTAVDDARRVANHLGIPYYVLNFQEVFQDTVINQFIPEYLQGRTPNPCIICNQYIKFEILLAKAEALGCRYIATGHYAQIKYDKDTKKYQLWRAIDPKKDQSYFLFRLTQNQINKVLFPLGAWKKEQVREKAAEIGLRVASKPDSQEICFIANNDYRDFLRDFAPQAINPGDIINTNGEVVGQHNGIAFYTIGQRKGLGVYREEPSYVIDILPETNKIVIGSSQETYSQGLITNNLNWLGYDFNHSLDDILVKIRYAAPLVPANLYQKGEKVEVIFKEPQRAVTPGQAVVFYQGDWVLGGGTITGRIK